MVKKKLINIPALLQFPWLPCRLLECMLFLKGQHVITSLGPIQLLALVITMTAGTVFAVWLGELISEYGFKDGISLLIFTGIVARLPVTLTQSAVFFSRRTFSRLEYF